MRIMVIGASSDRAKYGNKAVRAFLSQGHEVLPVNPHEQVIEGQPAFARVADVPGPIDRATLYVPPAVGVGVMGELAGRGDVAEVWLNPGADAPEVVAAGRRLGLRLVIACSILAIGENTASYRS
jgi:predicted CoA-binding protein